MHLMRSIVASAVLMIGGVPITFADNAHDAQSANDVSEAADRAVGSHLPLKFRALLIQEMLAVTDASKQILEALVRGQDDVVARNAEGIRDSFVLEQEMTDGDRQALHDALPRAFIERDQAFHALSERLVEAAHQGNQSRQREVFTEMVKACVACHTAHATDRFPNLTASAH